MKVPPLIVFLSIAEEEEKRIVEEEERRMEEILEKKEAEELELKRKKEERMFIGLFFVCLSVWLKNQYDRTFYIYLRVFLNHLHLM